MVALVGAEAETGTVAKNEAEAGAETGAKNEAETEAEAGAEAGTEAGAGTGKKALAEDHLHTQSIQTLVPQMLQKETQMTSGYYNI